MNFGIYYINSGFSGTKRTVPNTGFLLLEADTI